MLLSNVSILLLTLTLYLSVHILSAVHITLEKKTNKVQQGLFLMVPVYCRLFSNRVSSSSVTVAYAPGHNYCQDYRLVFNTETISCWSNYNLHNSSRRAGPLQKRLFVMTMFLTHLVKAKQETIMNGHWTIMLICAIVLSQNLGLFFFILCLLPDINR